MQGWDGWRMSITRLMSGSRPLTDPPQVPDGRGPLPSSVLHLLRSSRSAVLLYRTFRGEGGGGNGSSNSH